MLFISHWSDASELKFCKREMKEVIISKVNKLIFSYTKKIPYLKEDKIQISNRIFTERMLTQCAAKWHSVQVLRKTLPRLPTLQNTL
jgi:hypothetical protein